MDKKEKLKISLFTNSMCLMGTRQTIKLDENLRKGCGLIRIPLKPHLCQFKKVIHYVQGQNNKIHIALRHKNSSAWYSSHKYDEQHLGTYN